MAFLISFFHIPFHKKAQNRSDLYLVNTVFQFSPITSYLIVQENVCNYNTTSSQQIYIHMSVYINLNEKPKRSRSEKISDLP